jgi:hypothetical protein
MLVQVFPSGVGNLVNLLPVLFTGLDIALVLQHLEGGVHGARAGLIPSAGLFLQCLHHLVAVHRLF